MRVQEQGEEIAIDDWEIETLGIGGMRYSDEISNSLSIVLAPAAITQGSLEYQFPAFTCERAFSLDADEIRSIDNASVTLK